MSKIIIFISLLSQAPRYIRVFLPSVFDKAKNLIHDKSKRTATVVNMENKSMNNQLSLRVLNDELAKMRKKEFLWQIEQVVP